MTNTLEQKILEQANAQGINARDMTRKIQQKLVEVAKLSLDPKKAIDVARLLGAKMEESTVQEIYGTLKENPRDIKAFYEYSQAVPAFPSKELQDLVIADVLPVDLATNGIIAKDCDTAFFTNYLENRLSQSWFKDAYRTDFAKIKAQQPDKFNAAGKQVTQKAIHSKDLSLIGRIADNIPETSFTEYEPQLQELFVNLVCEGKWDGAKSLASLTNLNRKEDPRIQERYEHIFNRSSDDIQWLAGSIEKLYEVTGQSPRRTQSIEAVLQDKIIPYGVAWGSRLIKKLRNYIEISQEELTAKTREIIEKRILEPIIDKKYGGRDDSAFRLDDLLFSAQELQIELPSGTKDKVVSQLYRLSPKNAENVAKLLNIDLGAEIIQRSMHEQISDGRIDFTLNWAEYFCVRPEISPEHLNELGKVAIARATDSQYGKIAHLNQVEDLAALSEVNLQYDPKSVEKLYLSTMENSDISPAGLRKHLGIDYSPLVAQKLQERAKARLIRECQSPHPLYDHSVANMEQWSGISIPASTIEEIYDHHLQQGRYSDVRYASEQFGKDPRFQVSLERILSWVQAPTKDEKTEEENNRLEAERQRAVAEQEELKRREQLAKYTLAQNTERYHLDIMIPVGSENKFVYAQTKDGKEVVCARPLYECGYHAEILETMRKKYGELIQVSGGWIEANDAGVRLYGSSERFGTAPMDRVKQLLSDQRAVTK